MFDTDFVIVDSDEIRMPLAENLHYVIKRKKERLEAKEISNPAILLLLTTYGPVEIETYESCIREIAERDAFCVIFLVQPDGSGCIIHSNQPNWLCGSQVSAA